MKLGLVWYGYIIGTRLRLWIYCRDEAEMKLGLLLEKMDRDEQLYTSEKKSLLRQFEKEDRLKAFMACKLQVREKDEQMMAWQQKTGARLFQPAVHTFLLPNATPNYYKIIEIPLFISNFEYIGLISAVRRDTIYGSSTVFSSFL